MNIFEVIGNTTSGIEPFHSRFLAEALKESLRGDRSLFAEVWRLAKPSSWDEQNLSQVDVEVSAEKTLEQGRRVDICLLKGNPPTHVLAIEVKTTDASAKEGQLEKYRSDLGSRYKKAKIQVAFLTPFNRERAGDSAERLRSIKVFDEFRSKHREAKHLSWLDVAEIKWSQDPLWSQHQGYIRRYISPQSLLEGPKDGSRNRPFQSFFLDTADFFWVRLAEGLGIRAFDDGVEIDLSRYNNELRSVASSVTDAFGILLQSDRISQNAQRRDDFGDDLRRPFLESPYAIVHEALFDLSRKYNHVWVKGSGNYGIRTAHRDHLGSGVSLVTSKGPSHLVIGQTR